MPIVAYPNTFWSPTGLSTFHNTGGGAWVPTTGTTAHQVGVTFFTRAPVFFEHDAYLEAPAGLPWRPGNPLSAPPGGLQDLVLDPSWSLPWVNGGRLYKAATLPYVVEGADGLYGIRVYNPDLEDDDDHFQDFRIDPASVPTVAMAFWIDGTIGTMVQPLLAIIRFDEPLLLQSNAALPAFVTVPSDLVSYRYDDTDPYSASPGIGALGVRVPALEWESARAAHVWMQPQRVNMVANPSFEHSPYPYYDGYAGDDPHRLTPEPPSAFEERLWGWRANADVFEATNLKSVGPAPRDYSAHLVRFSGAPGAIVTPWAIDNYPDDSWVGLDQVAIYLFGGFTYTDEVLFSDIDTTGLVGFNGLLLNSRVDTAGAASSDDPTPVPTATTGTITSALLVKVDTVDGPLEIIAAWWNFVVPVAVDDFSGDLITVLQSEDGWFNVDGTAYPITINGTDIEGTS